MNWDWAVIFDNWSLFARGAEITVALSFATMALSIPCGLLLALLRNSRSRLARNIALLFVEFFRTTPVILLVYWVFYVLPVMSGPTLSEFGTAILALTLNVSAFNSETFRAGINSIRDGQINAALSMGMSFTQTMRIVVLPQAVPRVLPALASTWVSLFKDTSLVSVIAVPELTYVGLQLLSQTFRVLEILTAIGVLYWLMGYPQAKLADWIHHRFRVVE